MIMKPLVEGATSNAQHSQKKGPRPQAGGPIICSSTSFLPVGRHGAHEPEAVHLLQWASVDTAGPSTDAKEGMFRRLWSLKEVWTTCFHAPAC